MTETQQAQAGDWVEVECVLLEPADRSANLPAETAEKPLMMWVKGFAEGRAALGEPVTVETMTGRKVAGKLSAINPGYFHTFGEPIPELVHIGKDLRAQLAAYRAAENAAEGGAQSASHSAPQDGGA